MKYGEVDIPEDLIYTKKHLWARIQENVCTLGWTDYIQYSAGDVNYVELPEKGTQMELDHDFGSIETSKWVERLYSPVKGRVTEVNDVVVRNPVLINKTPFTDGWFIKVDLEVEAGIKNSMSPLEYLDYVKLCEEQ